MVRHNNQLPDNLPQLQNLIKRDPESYKEEVRDCIFTVHFIFLYYIFVSHVNKIYFSNGLFIVMGYHLFCVFLYLQLFNILKL